VWLEKQPLPHATPLSIHTSDFRALDFGEKKPSPVGGEYQLLAFGRIIFMKNGKIKVGEM
jgi:hypothetical protein